MVDEQCAALRQDFNVKEQKKSLYATDVLVDDYLRNLREYLRNTSGLALLIDQPWNRDRDEEIHTWIKEHRLQVLLSLVEVPPIVEGGKEEDPTRYMMAAPIRAHT